MEAHIKDDLLETVIRPVMPEELFDPGVAEIMVNPTGRFVTGGPQGDTGVTGRKIIVDTYGVRPRTAGALSRARTKVDRSASYAARWWRRPRRSRARRQVPGPGGLRDRRRPSVSVMVETFGTARTDPATLGALVQEHFDLRPGAIIRDLNLRNPIYARTAAYGHFGRSEPGFTWEETSLADDLRRAAGF